MRIDPPPSPPVARLTSPPETAAADPPEDPPAVRPRRHGLWVTPLMRVTLTLSPPNSLAVVAPTGTAPPRSSRRRDVVRGGRGDPVAEHERRLGPGPARHRLELLDGGGHAAERQRHVGRPSRVERPLGVDVGEAVQLGGLDGGERGLELLDRRALTGAEGVDEAAGVTLPGEVVWVGHAGQVATPDPDRRRHHIVRPRPPAGDPRWTGWPRPPATCPGQRANGGW